MTEQFRDPSGSHAGLVVVVTLALAAVASACNDTPTGPCCPSPPRPPGFVVTGIVFGDGQPLPNATIEAHAAVGAFPPWRTDASGRYRVELLNDVGVFLSVAVERFPFQPCAVWVEPARSASQERTADVHLASASGASSAGRQIVSGRRRVSGTVRTMTATGLQPVSSAGVTFPGANEIVYASTSTDTSGRFSLCGIPVDQRLFIYSDASYESELRWASTHVEPDGGDADIDLILD